MNSTAIGMNEGVYRMELLYATQSGSVKRVIEVMRDRIAYLVGELEAYSESTCEECTVKDIQIQNLRGLRTMCDEKDRMLEALRADVKVTLAEKDGLIDALRAEVSAAWDAFAEAKHETDETRAAQAVHTCGDPACTDPAHVILEAPKPKRGRPKKVTTA